MEFGFPVLGFQILGFRIFGFALGARVWAMLDLHFRAYAEFQDFLGDVGVYLLTRTVSLKSYTLHIRPKP